MDDPIANHYSQAHHKSGAYRQFGLKVGVSVPLKKVDLAPYLQTDTGANANVDERNYQMISEVARKSRKYKRKYDSDSDEYERKKKKTPKKKKMSKHKRSKIDEALGDDTY